MDNIINLEAYLERAIDQFGLACTLDMIGSICVAKADHIRGSYDDKTTARAWERSAGYAHRASNSARKALDE